MALNSKTKRTLGTEALILGSILAIDVFQARVLGKSSIVSDAHPLKFIAKNMLYAGALATVFVVFDKSK